MSVYSQAFVYTFCNLKIKNSLLISCIKQNGEKDLQRFQLFYSSPSDLSLFWYVCQLWNARSCNACAQCAGVIAAITMQLENVRLTIDDVVRLVRTGNFAILLPDSREKYNKARFKTDERNCAENGRACICVGWSQFLFIFRTAELSRYERFPHYLANLYFRFLR